MFNVGEKVHAKLKGVFRVAVIEDADSDPSTGSTSYYVHWLDSDRRMDAWLVLDDLQRLPQGRSGSGIHPKAHNTPCLATRSLSQREYSAPKATITDNSAVIKCRRETPRQQDSRFFSRPKNIRWFMIGRHTVESWYFTPYALASPILRAALDECAASCAMSASADIRVSSSPVLPVVCRPIDLMLYVCPFCLAPFQSLDALVQRHVEHVCRRRPPGNEVYRDMEQKIIIFEADGAVHRAYCERVALLSKAFLEHKTLDYDTTPFVFYTLCFFDGTGCTVAAYFSREKRNPERFNLSCILTLPHHQGKGLGRFLVDMSYEMTRREGRVGSPEKPLSDLGEKTYLSYWREAVVDALLPLSALEGRVIQLEQIMHITGMTQADVTAALRSLKLLDTRNSSDALLRLTPEVVAAHLENKTRRVERGDARFEPCLLCWFPSHYQLVTVSRKDLLRSITPAVRAGPLLGVKRDRSS